MILVFLPQEVPRNFINGFPKQLLLGISKRYWTEMDHFSAMLFECTSCVVSHARCYPFISCVVCFQICYFHLTVPPIFLANYSPTGTKIDLCKVERVIPSTSARMCLTATPQASQFKRS